MITEVQKKWRDNPTTPDGAIAMIPPRRSDDDAAVYKCGDCDAVQIMVPELAADPWRCYHCGMRLTEGDRL